MDPKISLLIPTRGRPDNLSRLFDSIKQTSSRVDGVEVVLVVDDDDLDMLAFEYEGVFYKRAVVRPGRRMGELNMTAYKASSGKYIMLLNDDVIIRTPGWDDKILACFRSYADEIVLVHVNDLIFKERLCTFPFVSRRFCDLAGELCPEEYHRHRIDDHIYNIFNLLGVMGRTRIVYLPDVVFEHEHYTLSLLGRRKYGMQGRIRKEDARLFERLLPQRKKTAVNLMAYIDGFARTDTAVNRERILDTVKDSNSIRKPEFVNTRPEGFRPNSTNTRVTIGVISADCHSTKARNCVDRIKRHTNNFDLILLESQHGPKFNYAREMNRIMDIVQTDYLVLLHDDVLVETGWIDGLQQCMEPDVGIVVPIHKDRDSNLSSGGIVFDPDRSGRYSQILLRPESARPIMTLCSACFLIDMNKCRHIRFNEQYSRYFFDIDYGLRIWEAGYQVVCSPFAEVTQVSGSGTVSPASLSSDTQFSLQRRHFESEWYESGRIDSLENNGFYQIPDLRAFKELSEDVRNLLKRQPSESTSEFRNRAAEVYRRITPFPILKEFLFDHVKNKLNGKFPDANDPENGLLAFLMGFKGHPVLMEPVSNGFHIIFCDQIYYAISEAERIFDLARIRRHRYDPQFSAFSLQDLEQKIRCKREKEANAKPVSLAHRSKCFAHQQLVALRLFCLVWLQMAQKIRLPNLKVMLQPGFRLRLIDSTKNIAKGFKSLRSVQAEKAGAQPDAFKLADCMNLIRQKYQRIKREYHHLRMMLCAQKQQWVIPAKAAASKLPHQDIQSGSTKISTESSRQTKRL